MSDADPTGEIENQRSPLADAELPASETLERHRRLRAIFDSALLRDPAARQAYVDLACADDPALQPEVKRLLALHQDAGSFLERPPDLALWAAPVEEQFTGNTRFRVVRQLGAGGMGVVYEVVDRVHDEVVALKTLARTSAAEVYRLKREFRSLADVTHHNLVCLYELFVEEERCFFTMELVKGVNFVDYARAPERPRTSHDHLVAVFRQLVAGVAALHRRGKLHRDIKPSNVLVTPEGRVVILDFGLVAEIGPAAGEMLYFRGGTPVYMSPEEGLGAPPSEASDWYSVGATLYEALTGTPPFSGAVLEVMRRKQTEVPTAPVHLARHVTTELSAVCMGLLQRLPADRLSGPEALRELDHVTRGLAPRPTAVAAREAPFVGRVRQLQSLNDAFQAVLDGRAMAVSVHGPSGIGKSTLVRRFLRSLTTRRDVVVLSGRCYENESVPYKALDGVRNVTIRPSYST